MAAAGDYGDVRNAAVCSTGKLVYNRGLPNLHYAPVLNSLVNHVLLCIVVPGIEFCVEFS